MSSDTNPSLEQIIVGFTQIDRAIGGWKHESVMQSTQGELQRATGDAQKTALMMMQLAGARPVGAGPRQAGGLRYNCSPSAHLCSFCEGTDGT